MKPKYFTHTLIIVFFFLTGCRSCDKDKNKAELETSIINEETAITFRNNFLDCPNQYYHIPAAFMFETVEFMELFNKMQGVEAVRLYPAINTHDDPADDSLTLIMVPVNGSDRKDNFSGYLFEYAKLCPDKCNCTGTYTAPTEDSLDYIIPTNFCVTKKTIEEVIAAGEEVVGKGNVYGIRFYTTKKDDGMMDLIIVPTQNMGDYAEDIGNISIQNATEACVNGAGCCDTESKLYRLPGTKK